MKGLPSRLRNRLLCEIDALMWRRSTAPVRALEQPAETGRVLICDLHSTLGSAKAESLLAAALRLRGLRPLVLVAAHWRPHRNAYWPVADAEFVTLKDFARPEDGEAAAALAGRILAVSVDFQNLLDHQIEGVRVGRHVLSRLLRERRLGSVDLAHPDQAQMVREILEESLCTVWAARRLIEGMRPSLGLFSERNYTPAGEVADSLSVAGIPYVQWAGAPLPNTQLFKRYTLDNRHLHPLALDDETWEQVLAEPWGGDHEDRLMELLRANYNSQAWFNRQQLQRGKTIQDSAQVIKKIGLDPKKKTAVIFSHILYDATFFFGTNLFKDYEEWLCETVRCAAANPNLNWIIKVHPVNVWRSNMDGATMRQLEAEAIERRVGTLPPHVRLMGADTDVNTYSLFQFIDYGLTVRGTVGMELPCFGIPTVTAGTGRYSGRGFTMDPETPDDYRRLLAQLHTVPRLDEATVTMARRYAYTTFFRRPHRIDSYSIDHDRATFGVPWLKGNITLNRASDFAQAADLTAFSHWAANTDRRDFLSS